MGSKSNIFLQWCNPHLRSFEKWPCGFQGLPNDILSSNLTNFAWKQKFLNLEFTVEQRFSLVPFSTTKKFRKVTYSFSDTPNDRLSFSLISFAGKQELLNLKFEVLNRNHVLIPRNKLESLLLRASKTGCCIVLRHLERPTLLFKCEATQPTPFTIWDEKCLDRHQSFFACGLQKWSQWVCHRSLMNDNKEEDDENGECKHQR